MARRNFIGEMALANYSYRYVISVVFIIIGLCAIIYGLYTKEYPIAWSGTSLVIIFGFQFIFFHFMLKDVSDPEENQRLSDSVGQPTVSSIFGARVYDIPDAPCKKCGKHRYDVYSDDSGKCSNCEEIYAIINITQEAKLLGRRTKDGQIQ